MVAQWFILSPCTKPSKEWFSTPKRGQKAHGPFQSQWKEIMVKIYINPQLDTSEIWGSRKYIKYSLTLLYLPTSHPRHLLNRVFSVLFILKITIRFLIE
jgi:hypothetical protein